MESRKNKPGILGWDTDEFPSNVYESTMYMYEVLKAAEIIEDGRIDNFIRERYSSFENGIGKKIVEGNTSLRELAALAESMGRRSVLQAEDRNIYRVY